MPTQRKVVGAGYSMSVQTGDVVTVVKLMRVVMLVPVMVFAVMFARSRVAQECGGKRPPLLPGFAVGFVVPMVGETVFLAALVLALQRALQ
jgi:uncharacterized membrane protein YadS